MHETNVLKPVVDPVKQLDHWVSSWINVSLIVLKIGTVIDSVKVLSHWFNG